MYLKAIVYSHKIRRFNISRDLSQITFQTNKDIVIADLQKAICKQIKNAIHFNNSSFSPDNSSICYLNHDQLIVWNEKLNRTRRKTKWIRYEQLSPVFQNGGWYYCVNDTYDGIHSICYMSEAEKKQLFSIMNCYCKDFCFYENRLYSVYYRKYGRKIISCKYSIENDEVKTFENSIDIDGDPWEVKLIPQKNLVVLLFKYPIYETGSYDVVFQYRNIETFEKVFETKVNVELRMEKLAVMCNGKYVVFAHIRGLMFFNTDNFELEANIHLPLVMDLTVCDNDNFCVARSPCDIVVFTPIKSNKNDILVEQIENCFDKNGFGHLLVKD